MKILMCTTRMSIGGAETHILSLSEALVSLGHSVTVASAGGLLVPELEKSGIAHVTLPLDRKDPLSVCRSLAGLNRAARGCNIVHAHGRIPAFICSVLSKRSSFPPFVTTAHGLYEAREPKKSLSRWGDGVIAVSRDVRKYLTDTYGLDLSHVGFIPNGVELLPMPSEIPPATHICASGRLDRDNERQFSDILSVISKLLHEGINLHLTVAGDGNIYPEIKKKADEINAEFPGSVELCGALSDTGTQLCGCGIFIGQSRAALEAMAAGKPAVIFGNGACAGTLTPENAEDLYLSNYIPKPCDNAVNELYNTLKSLISDEGKRRKAAGFSYGWVCSHNDISDIAQSTVSFYEKVISGRRNAFVLCGYYGARNLGDDATLSVLTRKIREDNPGAKIYVIARSHCGIPDGCTVIGRLNFPAIVRAMNRSGEFILGGGSLLQNSTSNRSLGYYSSLARLASKHGCRIKIIGGGTGPLHGTRAQKRAEDVIRLCSYVGLRDTESFEFAKRVTDRAELTEDPVLSFKDFDKRPPEDKFAVCLRPLSSHKADRHSLCELATAVSVLEKETGLTPVIVVMSAKDRKISRRLSKLCGASVIDYISPAECISRLSACRFVIGMRLHAAVFASLTDTPAVCLSYDPKVSSFAASRGLPCLDAYTFTVEKIIQACREAFPGK